MFCFAWSRPTPNSCERSWSRRRSCALHGRMTIIINYQTELRSESFYITSTRNILSDKRCASVHSLLLTSDERNTSTSYLLKGFWLESRDLCNLVFSFRTRLFNYFFYQLNTATSSSQKIYCNVLCYWCVFIFYIF